MSIEVMLKEVEAVRALSAVRFGDLPDRRFPDCPRCEENELIVNPHNCTARCGLCNWACGWLRELDA